MKLHKELGLPIDAKLTDRFADVYKKSMARLKDYQHEDGGWGWWQTDDSTLYLTALVLEGYYHLKEVGYAVNNDQIKSANQWLKKAGNELCNQLLDKKLIYSSPTYKFWKETQLNMDLAKAVYTMGLYGVKPPDKAISYLTDRINTLTPEALCYLSMTLKQANDSRYQLSYKRLLALANHIDDFASWEHTKTLLKRLGNVPSDYSDYTYYYTGVETTALGLETVLVVDPENTKLIESIKSWLLMQRDNNGWSNTKTTSQVFLALLHEQLLFDKTNTTNETLTINLANQLFKHHSLSTQLIALDLKNNCLCRS